MDKRLALGALGVLLLTGAGLLQGGRLIGYEGGELWGHAWVQWWHGEALPAWPAGTALVEGATSWPVVDPLPTALGAGLGRLVGYGASWNLLAMLGLLLAFFGGARLAREEGGDPLVGGLLTALGPVVLGSFASGLTEDWAIGLIPLAFSFLRTRPWVAGLLLGLLPWCGLYLAWLGGLGALVYGVALLAEDRRRLPHLAAAAGLALAMALPAAWLQGARLGGEGHRFGAPPEAFEPLWRLNPWKGADLASFFTPGPEDPEGALVRLHPAYLGLIPLGLAVVGRQKRWWILLLGAIALAAGPRLVFAGLPLGLDNPAVLLLRKLPFGDLFNHHGRLLLLGQVALATLAARGAARFPRLGLLAALEIALLSPLGPVLPTSPAALPEIWAKVPGEGAILPVPAAGPGVHPQRWLYEQRATGRPLRLHPNRPTPPNLDKLEGADALVARPEWIPAVEARLGPPDVLSADGAAWSLPR